MSLFIRHERLEGLAVIAQCDWNVTCEIVSKNIVLQEDQCTILSEIKTPSTSRFLDLADKSKGVVINNTPSLHFTITPSILCALDSSADLFLHVVLRCTPPTTGVEVVWNCVLTPSHHLNRGFEKVSLTDCVMDMETDGFVVATSRYSYSFPRYWKGIDIKISSVAMSRILLY